VPVDLADYRLETLVIKAYCQKAWPVASKDRKSGSDMRFLLTLFTWSALRFSLDYI
jgi:hypothetical protein